VYPAGAVGPPLPTARIRNHPLKRAGSSASGIRGVETHSGGSRALHFACARKSPGEGEYEIHEVQFLTKQALLQLTIIASTPESSTRKPPKTGPVP
jgi:hypothetical protein